MSEYSAEVLANLRAPHGAGRFGAEATDIAEGVAVSDDGRARIELQLQMVGARIEAARFRAFGCPVTIAVASELVRRIEGLERARAAALSGHELALALRLSAGQAERAELALRALREALGAAYAPRP